jgi:hypothetical protein
MTAGTVTLAEPVRPEMRRARRRIPYSPPLSRAIDRAVVQLEAADDPAVADAWRAVLNTLLEAIDSPKPARP